MENYSKEIQLAAKIRKELLNSLNEHPQLKEASSPDRDNQIDLLVTMNLCAEGLVYDTIRSLIKHYKTMLNTNEKDIEILINDFRDNISNTIDEAMLEE